MTISHLGLGSAVGVVLGREVGDDEPEEARADRPRVADPPQGQLSDLPAVRTLGDVGDDGVGETRDHHVV